MGERKLKKLLWFCFAVSVLFIFNSSAYSAGALQFEKNDISIQLYGQINRAVLFTYDGDGSDTYHVDNDFSSTRIGAKVMTKPTEGLTVGGHIQLEYQSNASNVVTQTDSNTDDDDFDDRIIEAFVEGKFGKLSLGQGQMASDGTTEMDLSGTKVIGASKVQAFAGGTQFYDKVADALAGTDVQVKDVFNNMDGLGRADRIRYDSPKFSGFQLSVSTMSENGDDAEDIALRYKNKFRGVKVQSAVSYVNYRSSDSKDNQLSGSVTCFFDNGVNVTVAAGNRDLNATGRDDATFYYGKLGYIAKICPLGDTAIAVDYGEYNDLKVENDEAKTAGVMAVQNLKKWNTQFYVGFRHYELDRDGADFDDIEALMAGIRIKFQ